MFAESYRFPKSRDLYDRPTLLMSLENSGARKQQIEASYLAGNLSWNADYVLTVTRDDKNATWMLGHRRQQQRHRFTTRVSN